MGLILALLILGILVGDVHNGRVMFRINTKSVNRIIILSVVIILFGTSCKTIDKLFPQISKEEAEEVRNICNNLKPPPSFVKTHERYGVKTGHALQTIQYSSSDSYDEVEKYYVDLLTHSGWTFSKERAGTDNLIFKKDKYSVVIGSASFSFVSNKVYTVSCSIGIR